jgi:alginate O-acetyltransferase complex protein AlgI
MIFSSVEFFVFLALLLTAIGLTRRETPRRIIMLAASYLFYAWSDWRACFLLLGVTLVGFLAARGMAGMGDRRARRPWLLAGVATNLGVLAFFKYTGFLAANLQPLFRVTGLELPRPEVVLPVGISFFTFQCISYLSDVYRGTLPAHRNLRDYMLFVAFFPQLLAGPIVRGGQFLPQMEHEHPLRAGNLRLGIERFIRGFAKKVLFADILAVWANPVFAHPASYSPVTVWLAALAYAGQIYYDFSGYTDMAIGVARMFGIEYPENFRHPYRSLSIAEFWQRWHITLSNWLRDYLFLPLAYAVSRRIEADRPFGVRAETWSYAAAILITMFLGGLWHGASWTFVAWGALHGLALAVHRLVRDTRGRRAQGRYGTAGRVVSWATTFLFLLVTWVLFRAPDFTTAWAMLRRMAFLDGVGGIHWFYVQGLVALAAGVLSHLWSGGHGDRSPTLDLRRPLAWPALAALLLALVLFAPWGQNPFIYLQF